MKPPTKTNNTIRLTKWLASLAAFAALTGSGGVDAQTWETVLDYQFVSGLESGGWSIAADTAGNVFAGGDGWYSATSYVFEGLVLKTDTTGTTWQFSDDTNPSRNLYSGSVLFGVGVDYSGNAYSVGGLGGYWLVRKSSDGGSHWSTVDSFQYASGASPVAYGFGADGSGNIFVAGTATDKTGSWHWVVRKSSNAGQSWATVDDLKGGYARTVCSAPGGIFAVGQSASGTWLVRRSVNGGATWSTVDTLSATGVADGACSDNSGNIYVAGLAFITTQPATKHTAAQGYGAWVIRRSSDGGATWSTVDQFSEGTGFSARGWGMAKDSAGHPVAVGCANDTQGVQHWLVRRPDSSGVWQTVDDFQPGYGAAAVGVARDAAGNLLVTGSASDAMKTDHWIVRRLPYAAP
jgi:hypothetical protein